MGYINSTKTRVQINKQQDVALNDCTRLIPISLVQLTGINHTCLLMVLMMLSSSSVEGGLWPPRGNTRLMGSNRRERDLERQAASYFCSDSFRAISGLHRHTDTQKTIHNCSAQKIFTGKRDVEKTFLWNKCRVDDQIKSFIVPLSKPQRTIR